ncbi:hypothetical protein V8E53_000831, partial [Lactarius tabidus]
SFTVRTHHVLVHEHATGGESLDVVYSDEHAQQAQLSGSLLWRIWRKDVSTVEWMHARFVVHRDIKLESTSPFPLKKEKLTFRKPLVKLTDFGLVRKIDPDGPRLCTNCGFESCAAPELL